MNKIRKRRKDRKTERQNDRKTERQKDRKTKRQRLKEISTDMIMTYQQIDLSTETF